MSGTGDKLKCVVSFNFFSRGPNNQGLFYSKKILLIIIKLGRFCFTRVLAVVNLSLIERFS